MTANAITYFGKSGTRYDFELYSLRQEFKPLPGIYVIGRFVPAVGYITRAHVEALYVGETQSFYDRLNANAVNHDGYKRALSLNPTHIAVMICRDGAERLRIETDLRHALDPVCNRQPVNALTRATLRL